jgi:hypothetical protein
MSMVSLADYDERCRYVLRRAPLLMRAAFAPISYTSSAASAEISETRLSNGHVKSTQQALSSANTFTHCDRSGGC